MVKTLAPASLRRLAVLVVAAFVLVAAPLVGAPRAHADDAADRVKEVFEDVLDAVEIGDAERAWELASELESLGDDAVDPLMQRLDVSKGRVRLVAAKTLFVLSEEVESDELGERAEEAALRAFRELALDEDGLTDERILAIQLLTSYGTKKDVGKLAKPYEEEREPLVKVAMARALRLRNDHRDAERLLKGYVDSDDREIRRAAALALAEIGNIEAAKAVLNKMKDEPTETGRRAKMFLRMEEFIKTAEKTAGLTEKDPVIKLLQKEKEELERKLAAALKGKGGPAAAGAGNPLLDELVRKIRLYYVDEDKTKKDDLIDAAAKGLVGSLDPFSSYMTEKETDKFRETLGQEYAGIGAVVQVDPRTRYLTIIRPIYSGPAYRAGLRSLDQVVEVEGESTYNKTVEELVGKLKGPKGSPVEIKVYRKGWRRPREFTLKRDEIVLQSVYTDMLPGDIGYLRLSQFGEKATQEVEDALKTLEDEGMRALIFDLRGNPGGLLSAAVEVSDKFLGDDRLIVYSEGRNPQIAPRREFRTHDANTHPPYPMIVLIDGSSASASEIVSGALQDHGRATLVGLQTFGKGSVQQLMPVETTKGRTTLRLTIAYYYLPSGRCIHRALGNGVGGVDPDVVVTLPDEHAWVIEERDRLIASREVDAYIEKHWLGNKELLKELSDFDGFETSKWPEFQEWFEGLGTKLEPEHVREVVRSYARRLAQDDVGREFAQDLQSDVVLQSGVLAALEKLGEEPAEHDRYKILADRLELARADAEKKADADKPAPPIEEGGGEGEKEKAPEGEGEGEGEKKPDGEGDGEGEKKDPVKKKEPFRR